MSKPLTLPFGLQKLVERLASDLLQPPGMKPFDFTVPPGEPALAAADSVSWQVFRNPVSLFIGGVTAVILELAEPRVRSGVWEHSSFRTDPVDRLRRTGLAAMVTVYGARSEAEKMIAGVRRAHDRITGETPAGAPYRANDPELLSWVQATAQFGFLEAYTEYVRPLSQAERDRFHAEGAPAAELYGSVDTPLSESALRALMAAMTPRLEASQVIMEFLRLMRSAPVLPAPFRPVQHMLVRAAVAIVPSDLRPQLDLGHNWDFRPGEGLLVRRLARIAERIRLNSSPATQASIRLGLSPDYLYARRATRTASAA
jgi:uncharacterized protein (DUF2236 family)